MNQEKTGKFIQRSRKEKSDETLFKQIKSNGKNSGIRILGSIMQGVGVALLFVPTYKTMGETIGAVIVTIGLILFVVGLCIRIKQ